MSGCGWLEFSWYLKNQDSVDLAASQKNTDQTARMQILICVFVALEQTKKKKEKNK